MNDELQKQIAAILKQALEAAQHGGQWLSGQIPDVLNQLLVWTMAMGVAGLLIVLVMAWLNVRAWRCYIKTEDWGVMLPVAAFAQLLFLLLSLLPFGLLLDGLKAAIAPKLFLLEYAAHLLK